MTREKIIVRLKKMLEHERSARELGNIAEAEAFAAKVQEFLDKHELTMSEVEYAKLKEEDPMGMSHTKATKRTRVAWQQNLASTIAWAHHCRILVYPGSDRLAFVGRASHREAATYVYQVLQRFASEQSAKDYNRFYWECEKRGDRQAARGYVASWLIGFNKAILDRYREERRRREEEMRAANNSTALIRLDNAVAAVDQYMKEQIRTVKVDGVSGRYGGNSSGRQAGYRRGREANINPGLNRGGSSGHKGYLQ